MTDKPEPLPQRVPGATFAADKPATAQPATTPDTWPKHWSGTAATTTGWSQK